MLISEMIEKLSFLLEKNGDSKLIFSARDYYTRYGFECSIQGIDRERLWEGTFFNKETNVTRIDIDIKPDHERRLPKVTFRKPK